MILNNLETKYIEAYQFLRQEIEGYYYTISQIESMGLIQLIEIYGEMKNEEGYDSGQYNNICYETHCYTHE